MAYDLESILKLGDTFGNLPPLTEAQKKERRELESKAFTEENYRTACKNLAATL